MLTHIKGATMKIDEKIYTDKLRELELPYSPPRTDIPYGKYYEAGVIRKKDLIDGRYYQGTCRNSDVAKWSEKDNCFTYKRYKFSSVFDETINHLEDDNGYDLFLPYNLLEYSDLEECDILCEDIEDGYEELECDMSTEMLARVTDNRKDNGETQKAD